jgi:methylmalonyl-CoA/ethylmalonyl-CoA epimerase
MASIPLSWVPQGTFHHVGFVVASIQNSVKGFAESLDADWDGVITHDPNQVVRVTFLRSKSAADPLFELIEPAGEKSPVMPFLKKGGGLHHLCYEVHDLEKQLELIRSRGGLITRSPMPAAAFGGRRIAWIYTRSKLLIEYLECNAACLTASL